MTQAAQAFARGKYVDEGPDPARRAIEVALVAPAERRSNREDHPMIMVVLRQEEQFCSSAFNQLSRRIKARQIVGDEGSRFGTNRRTNRIPDSSRTCGLPS